MRKSPLLLALPLLLLACRRGDAPEPARTTTFMEGAPRLIVFPDSFGTYYVRIDTDEAARTVTFNADTTGNTAYTRFHYNQNGELVRMDERFPGATDRTVTIARVGNAIIFTGSKPSPDSANVTDLGGGRKQVDMVVRSWSSSGGGPQSPTLRSYHRVLVNAAGNPERVTDSTVVQGQPGYSFADTRLYYGLSGAFDSLRTTWSGTSTSSVTGYTTYRANRSGAVVDSSLAHFFNSLTGSDLQWSSGHLQLLPSHQLLSTYIFSYFDTDGRYFHGGIPTSEYIREYRYHSGIVQNLTFDYRTTVQAGGHVTFLERRDLLLGQQPFRAYIYY